MLTPLLSSLRRRRRYCFDDEDMALVCCSVCKTKPDLFSARALLLLFVSVREWVFAMLLSCIQLSDQDQQQLARTYLHSFPNFLPHTSPPSVLGKDEAKDKQI